MPLTKDLEAYLRVTKQKCDIAADYGCLHALLEMFL